MGRTSEVRPAIFIFDPAIIHSLAVHLRSTWLVTYASHQFAIFVHQLPNGTERITPEVIGKDISWRGVIDALRNSSVSISVYCCVIWYIHWDDDPRCFHFSTYNHGFSVPALDWVDL